MEDDSLDPANYAQLGPQFQCLQEALRPGRELRRAYLADARRLRMVYGPPAQFAGRNISITLGNVRLEKPTLQGLVRCHYLVIKWSVERAADNKFMLQ